MTTIINTTSTTSPKISYKISGNFRSSRSSSGGMLRKMTSIPRPSSSSSTSRVGTFRARTQARQAEVDATKARVNTNTRLSNASTGSYNHNNYGNYGYNNYRRPSMFGSSFLGSLAGGFIGSRISHMFMGNSGYNPQYGAYSQGPGMFTSSIFNLIFFGVIIWIGYKLFKRFFGSNNYNSFGTPSGGYSPNNFDNQEQHQANDDAFDDQSLRLTKLDAKNYINDLPELTSDERLKLINKIDAMHHENDILDFVEEIEKEVDSRQGK